MGVFKERLFTHDITTVQTKRGEAGHPVSYSQLSSLWRDVRGFLEHGEPTLPMRLGSAFDVCMENEPLFNERYKVRVAPKPSNTLGLLTDVIIAGGDISIITNADVVNKLCTHNSFWKTTKDPVKLAAKWQTPELLDYLKEWQVLKNTKEEYILDLADHANVVNSAVDAKQKIHDYISDTLGWSVAGEQIEFYYQPSFLATIFGYECVVKPDLIIVNYTQGIVLPIDFKYRTTAKNNMIFDFVTFRYDIQYTFYTVGLTNLVYDFNQEHGSTLVCKPLEFLSVTPHDNRPFFFRPDGAWLNRSMDGWTTPSGFRYRGIEELISELNVRINTGDFTNPIIEKSNGFLKIPCPKDFK